jgi:hypothetical protein
MRLVRHRRRRYLARAEFGWGLDISDLKTELKLN